MMKTVLFITNHPAPYMNRWFESLDKVYKIQVLYYFDSATYKIWKDFKPFKGLYLKNENLFSMTRLLLKCDFIILCGIDKPKYWFSLFILILTKRNFALYSDYPYNTKPKYFYLRKMLFKYFVPYFYCATDSACECISSRYNIDLKKFFVFPYAHNHKFENINNNCTQISVFDKTKIRIFVANSFYKRKGYATLFKSFKLLKEANLLDEFDVKIAGVGDDFELYKDLFSQLGSNIQLLGWIEDNDYNTIMQETDVYLHPSDFEPFGIPPLDAMENGKLLISTTGVKSVDSIIENKVNGFLIEPGDYNHLYSIFKYLVSHRSEIYEIGNRAQKTVRAYYPQNKIIESLNSCIK